MHGKLLDLVCAARSVVTLPSEFVPHDFRCSCDLRRRDCACNRHRFNNRATEVADCDDDPGFEPGIHRRLRRKCRPAGDRYDVRCWRERAAVGRQRLPVAAQRSSSSRRRSRRHLWSTEDVDHRCNSVRVGIPRMRNGAKHSVLVGGAPGAGRERRFIDAEQSGDFGNGLLRRGKGSGDRSLGSRRRWCGGDWPGARWMADRLRIVAADLPD